MLVCARVPVGEHHILARVCSLLRSLVADSDFHGVRRSHGLAEYVLVAFGGRLLSTERHLDEAWAFVKNRWVPLPNAPPRCSSVNGTSVVHGGDLYTMGGEYSFDMQPTDLVHRFNFLSNQWSVAPAMPAPRASAAAGSVGGCLVVAGGEENLFEAVADAALFDGSAWTALPAMPYAVSGAAVFTWGSSLYVVGGGGDDGSWAAERAQRAQLVQDEEECEPLENKPVPWVQSFDTVTKTWQLRARLPDEFLGGGCGALHEGKYYLLRQHRLEWPSFACYDPSLDAWMVLPRLHFDRTALEPKAYPTRLCATSWDGGIAYVTDNGRMTHLRLAGSEPTIGPVRMWARGPPDAFPRVPSAYWEMPPTAHSRNRSLGLQELHRMELNYGNPALLPIPFRESFEQFCDRPPHGDAAAPVMGVPCCSSNRCPNLYASNELKYGEWVDRPDGQGGGLAPPRDDDIRAWRARCICSQPDDHEVHGGGSASRRFAKRPSVDVFP